MITVMKRRALQILWPAFLMAGVMEALLFVVVDPSDLQWFGATPLDWSRQAIYTVTFMLCWGVIATSGALTLLLVGKADEPDCREPL